MIYTFTKIPQSQPYDLTKAFDSMQTTPDTATKVGELTISRNSFYAEASKAIRAPLTEVQDSLDWMVMMQYLNNGPDMLELLVKQGNYPAVLAYMPVTTGAAIQEASGKITPP